MNELITIYALIQTSQMLITVAGFFLTIKTIQKMNENEKALFKVLTTDIGVLKNSAEKLIAQNDATATKLQAVLAGGVTADNSADIQALIDEINTTTQEVVADLAPAATEEVAQP